LGQTPRFVRASSTMPASERQHVGSLALDRRRLTATCAVRFRYRFGGHFSCGLAVVTPLGRVVSIHRSDLVYLLVVAALFRCRAWCVLPVWSGKRAALLPLPPLRTVRDGFPSYGSSLSKLLRGSRRHHGGIRMGWLRHSREPSTPQPHPHTDAALRYMTHSKVVPPR